MSNALRSPRARRATALLASATLLASGAALLPAGPSRADETAGRESRGTIGHLPASDALGIAPRIDVSSGNDVIAIAPQKNLTDAAKLTASSGHLWFSRTDDWPGELNELKGVPVWGQPHWGTDAKGRSVAVYPRCTGGLARNCDLYAWDVAANTERKLTEVDADGVGELEGTIQHGAVAWTTALPADLDEPVAEQAPTARALNYRTAAGKATQLTRSGGTGLALRSGVVAQNRTLRPTSDDGERQVELVKAGGKVTPLYKYADAAAPRWAVGLHFFGSELRFGMASQDHASLIRVPLANPSARRVVPTSYTFTSLAFARRDLVVWIGESNKPNHVKLISDFIPKRFA